MGLEREQRDQWSTSYGRQMTEEEYREIRDNLSGFLKILHEWDKNCQNKLSTKYKKEGYPYDRLCSCYP